MNLRCFRQTVVRKYNHNQSRSSRPFTPLEISRSKYLFREQIECNVYASYVICWCDNLFFRAGESRAVVLGKNYGSRRLQSQETLSSDPQGGRLERCRAGPKYSAEGLPTAQNVGYLYLIEIGSAVCMAGPCVGGSFAYCQSLVG